MDWLAVSSYGIYPTPGVSASQRAAYFVTYGLLGLLPGAVGTTAANTGGLFMDMFMST